MRRIRGDGSRRAQTGRRAWRGLALVACRIGLDYVTLKRMKGLVVAATPIKPDEQQNCWSFHLVNDSPAPIESVVLAEVSYEWGDSGNTKRVDRRFGSIQPGTCTEIWRDDSDAAELRMTLTLLFRDGDGERKLVVELPMLYRVRKLIPVPRLGRRGVVGATFE
jgi:hypothetical protein